MVSIKWYSSNKWIHQNPGEEHRQHPFWTWPQQLLARFIHEGKRNKAKMNYWDFIKIRSFCTAKDTVNKTTRHPTEWEKILANDVSDKGLVSKIYKELIKLNIQETIQSWNGQKTKTEISPKKTYTWPTSTWENALHHLHQGNTNQNHNEIPPHTSENGEN